MKPDPKDSVTSAGVEDALPEAGASLDALLEALREPEPAGLRQRVLERVTLSASQHLGLITSRGGRRARWSEPAPGVRLRSLYHTEAAGRPGQPQQVWLLELQAGARWSPPAVATGQQVECLVIEGAVRLESASPVELQTLDFHVQTVEAALPEVLALTAARLYVRHAPRSPSKEVPSEPPHEALREAASDTSPAETSRDQPQAWAEIGPGLRRRPLWAAGGEAAYLVRAERGAQVPEHGHGHDEECLMLEGDLFLGDVLLRAGDWQLAPLGSHHGHHFTDTGLLLLVRGDAVMQFESAGA